MRKFNRTRTRENISTTFMEDRIFFLDYLYFNLAYIIIKIAKNIILISKTKNKIQKITFSSFLFDSFIIL